MKIQQFRLLASLPDFHTITALARRFNLTQSAVSKQLMSIEKQLDFKVVDHDSHRLNITESGTKAIEHARAIINDYDCICAEVKKLQNANGMTISIGAIPILEAYGITDMLFEYREKYPNVELELSESATLDIFESLNNGKIDVGLVRTIFLCDSGYDIYPVDAEKYVLMVNQRNPLADMDSVDITHVQDGKFLLMGDPYYTVFYDEIFKHRVILPEIRYTNMRMTTMVAYIKNDASLMSLLPYGLACYYKEPEVQIVNLRNSPMLYMSIITRKGSILSPELSGLIEHLRCRLGSADAAQLEFTAEYV